MPEQFTRWTPARHAQIEETRPDRRVGAKLSWCRRIAVDIVSPIEASVSCHLPEGNPLKVLSVVVVGALISACGARAVPADTLYDDGNQGAANCPIPSNYGGQPGLPGDPCEDAVRDCSPVLLRLPRRHRLLLGIGMPQRLLPGRQRTRATTPRARRTAPRRRIRSTTMETRVRPTARFRPTTRASGGYREIPAPTRSSIARLPVASALAEATPSGRRSATTGSVLTIKTPAMTPRARCTATSQLVPGGASLIR